MLVSSDITWCFVCINTMSIPTSKDASVVGALELTIENKKRNKNIYFYWYTLLVNIYIYMFMHNIFYFLQNSCSKKIFQKI